MDDHLGSSSVLIDESGHVVDSVSYYPFGDVRVGGNYSKYVYNSKELDGTGLLYYGARYYELGWRGLWVVNPLSAL